MEREGVSEQLQPLLVELTDLALIAKQAHWNMTGPLFRPLHLQLDEVTDDVRGWADQVAERLVTLGVPADGRVETVARNTPFSTFEAGFVADEKVLSAILERLDLVIDRTRERIERLESIDRTSQDLLVAVAAGLEKHRWMLAAQRA
ncbi:MAG: DNA starvation/stationary phase protection protein [Acidimicrobiales bacterium]|jgi:starvation-inducible DNA-binding protein